MEQCARVSKYLRVWDYEYVIAGVLIEESN